jgi:hypothetical protein
MTSFLRVEGLLYGIIAILLVIVGLMLDVASKMVVPFFGFSVLCIITLATDIYNGFRGVKE